MSVFSSDASAYQVRHFIGNYYYGTPYVAYPYYGNYYNWYNSYAYPYYGYFNYGSPYYGRPFYGASFRQSTYAAIAYSEKQDKAGYSFGQSSMDYSTAAAVKGCGADDCAAVVWVQGGCAVLTSSKEQKRVGWGYGQSKSEAATLAMRSCRSGGAKDCESRTWVCSF